MHAIAARIGSKEPVFVDVDEPVSPAAGEVICRTLELGICGTDREILESACPLVPPNTEHLILGHECLGRVVAVGDDVSELSVGDLVVPLVRRSNVATSRADLLPFGRYVERGIVYEHGFSAPVWKDRPEFLLPVGNDATPFAVLAEPVSVAEKAVNEALAVQRGRLGATAWTQPPPRVLVTGMGPIGFAAVLASRARGWPVTMYGRDDVDSFRATLAVAFGASYLPDARADFAPADVERDGFDLILECTGSDRVMIRAARSLAACGVMVWLGAARVPRAAEHNLAEMMRNGILRNHVHLGTVNSARRDFRDALTHLAEVNKQQPQLLQSLITCRVSPDEALWHYRHRQPQGIKTVVVYDT